MHIVDAEGGAEIEAVVEVAADVDLIAADIAAVLASEAVVGGIVIVEFEVIAADR